MKHLPTDSKEVVQRALSELSLSVDDGSIDLMLRHLDFVIEANRSTNLTAITDPHKALGLHLVDSLSSLPETKQAPEGPMADLGTGGGFPGIELAIASGRATLLVDSVRKKLTALQRFLAQESLESWISVSAVRAEELAQQRPAQFAVVTARALSSLPSLVELAAPLLLENGHLIAMKGRLDETEYTRALQVASVCGMKPGGRRQFLLPGGSEQREIVVFIRSGTSKIKLPRRVGLAQHQPLA